MVIASPSADCIVVGGGVVGSAIALTMQARGLSTIVVDPVAARRAASWGNAGHIATEQVEPLASRRMIRAAAGRLFMCGGPLALPPLEIRAWLPFVLRMIASSEPSRFEAGKNALRQILSQAIPAWRTLLELGDAPHLMKVEGHYLVWESPASAEAGRRAWNAADTGTATFTDAAPAEHARLAQLIGRRPSGVIRFRGSGQITDLEELANKMATKFARLGGRQICAAASRLVPEGRECTLELDDGRSLFAGVIVIAAGVHSGELLRPLGHKVPIVAERGYHIQVCDTAWPADLPPVVFEDRAMIVSRFQSEVRASSFVEFARPTARADPRKWKRLERHAGEVGISLGDSLTRWMGARPTLPDYLPAIGRSEAAHNLYYAFGHQHLGLTLAAATGEGIAALVTGGRPEFDLAPFSLQRFSRI